MHINTLGQIAQIKPATIFREKAPPLGNNGNVHALTIKDLIGGLPWSSSMLASIEIDKNLISNCLSGNEILIPSRGDKYPATYIEDKFKGTFPYGQIHIITPKDGVLSRYLCWYMNLPKIQAVLLRNLAGTSIKALNRPNLSKIEIEIPSIQQQEKISQLQALLDESSALKKRLTYLEAQEVEWTCRKLLNEY